MRKVFLLVFILATGYWLLATPPSTLAGPQSTSYELRDYTFGAGGTTSNESTTYSLFGASGEVEYNSLTSTNYRLGGGLNFTILANTPAAPTFTNPATNYDRLKFVIDTGGNPTDTVYAIAISTDNFAADTRYIQDDNTVGSALGAEDYQTYTNWGGATGEFVRQLQRGTTYYIKAKARQGNYTESPYSAVSSATTSDPSLTFGLDSSTISFSNLNVGNSYTDSAKQTVLTTSTNAYGGYIVYGKATQALTNDAATGTISNFSGTNSIPLSWTGAGFGYTTDDSALSGGTVDRFTNGGPKYAGFVTSGNGDPVADHTDVVETSAISDEEFTISYRVTATTTTRAGTYRNTLMYIIVPTF
ncbi:MAG: hypothetical protein A2798_04015 [Candidatus Levybacteria bacterium RIFCSPHIGHO2_01_FULL_37_17]|nr:MAG: hypothetical protein A2798_04015 [Candidatus Levybacteria bacterium RIFCSPHIGHO2_01_FULL_37_17]OGH36534.1 MAG: hypothetical protein A2959_03520 [Candidatus Levybacteria bacterium RIFCSPLOWO2_01_FULL_38_23]